MKASWFTEANISLLGVSHIPEVINQPAWLSNYNITLFADSVTLLSSAAHFNWVLAQHGLIWRFDMLSECHLGITLGGGGGLWEGWGALGLWTLICCLLREQGEWCSFLCNVCWCLWYQHGIVAPGTGVAGSAFTCAILYAACNNYC